MPSLSLMRRNEAAVNVFLITMLGAASHKECFHWIQRGIAVRIYKEPLSVITQTHTQPEFREILCENVYSCQMEDSIQICCGMGCPLTPSLMKSMYGVPVTIQSLHRWKAALPWASREAVALRSTCMLVAAARSLRFKPLEGSLQGGPTLNFLAKVWYIHFFCY